MSVSWLACMDMQQLGTTNVDDGFVLLHGTQDIQTAEFPFSTVGGEYRRGADASMYRSSFLVDEGECFLHKQHQRWTRCAVYVVAYSNIV
jgi:hypothetical protein